MKHSLLFGLLATLGALTAASVEIENAPTDLSQIDQDATKAVEKRDASGAEGDLEANAAFNSNVEKRGTITIKAQQEKGRTVSGKTQQQKGHKRETFDDEGALEADANPDSKVEKRSLIAQQQQQQGRASLLNIGAEHDDEALINIVSQPQQGRGILKPVPQQQQGRASLLNIGTQHDDEALINIVPQQQQGRASLLNIGTEHDDEALINIVSQQQQGRGVFKPVPQHQRQKGRSSSQKHHQRGRHSQHGRTATVLEPKHHSGRSAAKLERQQARHILKQQGKRSGGRRRHRYQDLPSESESDEYASRGNRRHSHGKGRHGRVAFYDGEVKVYRKNNDPNDFYMDNAAAHGKGL